MKITRSILFISILFLFSGMSCFKEPELVELDPEILPYVDFLPGTYWVYNVYTKDTIFVRTDSILVTRRVIGYNYTTGRPSRKNQFLSLCTKYNGKEARCGSTVDGITNVYYGIWDLPYRYLNPISDTPIVINDYTDTIITRLDSLVVDKKTYYDVLRVSEFAENRWFYAKHIGVIKEEYYNHDSLKILVKYNINQLDYE
jgi:hypothetical protein